MSAAKAPTRARLVVDGSNLGTEGRTTPSLQQLDEVVRAYLEENPKTEVIVVADATFEHRVAPSERARFKEAELAGEIVTPPAGAVGRGDAFILKIAARINDVVLSNDSFQEFQEEHPWLFEQGRLVGGKPVPGVGWVFTERLPVRGTKSPRSVKKLTVALPDGAKPAIGATITPVKSGGPKIAKSPAVKAAKAPAKRVAKTKERSGPVPAKVAKVELTRVDATKSAGIPSGQSRRVQGSKKVSPVVKKASPTVAPVAKKVLKATKVPTRGTTLPSPAEPAVALRRRRQPVNPETDFAAFVTAHRIRAKLAGEVLAFTSHGAIIAVALSDGRTVECYAPTTALGTPPPARARDVLKRGDRREFRLTSVDKDRRIAELALS